MVASGAVGASCLAFPVQPETTISPAEQIASAAAAIRILSMGRWCKRDRGSRIRMTRWHIVYGETTMWQFLAIVCVLWTGSTESLTALEHRAAVIRPAARELRWKQIAWTLDLGEGQRIAQSE